MFPAGFPSELAAEAFVHSGEAAWRPNLAVLSVQWFGAHGYAVLGTEVLRPEQGGIRALPYFQSVNRGDNEDWSSFIARAAAETIAYLQKFEQEFAGEGDVYVNVTWVSVSEFQNLKAV
jgi:hypothetical protein